MQRHIGHDAVVRTHEGGRDGAEHGAHPVNPDLAISAVEDWERSAYCRIKLHGTLSKEASHPVTT